MRRTGTAEASAGRSATAPFPTVSPEIDRCLALDEDAWAALGARAFTDALR